MSRRFFPSLGFAVALCVFAATAAHSQQPAAADSPEPVATPTPPPAPAVSPPAPPRHVSFFVGRTVLWSGRTAVVPLHTDRATATDESFPVAISEAGVVEILRPPTVLAGETTGFLRVRALHPGQLRILVHGEAALDIQIKNDPAGAAYFQVDAESPRPRIVSPIARAVVWGQFGVGVEVFDASPNPGAEPKVSLRLPGGKLLEPVSRTTAEQGPARHYQFEVSADDLPPGGRARLVAVSSPAGFSDVERMAKAPGSLYESEPLELSVLPARNAAVWSGECDDPAILGVTRDLYGPARPPNFGIRQPVSTPDAAASGGQTVACPGHDPVWSMPFIVKEPGDYQFVARTRGEFGVGAYPTVSLYVNNSENPVGSARLAGTKYHRLPIGGTFHLDAGPELLTVAFRNDASAGKEDRNLFLDRYELARVGDSPPPDPTPASRRAARAAAAAAPAAPTPAPPVSLDPPDFRPVVAYPANGAAVFGADAVVARVPGGGIVRPAWVDILLDGQPLGVRCQSPSPADAILLPFVARQIAPGSHRLAVRVADSAGRVTDSPAQTLTVLANPPAARGPYDRAVFLLDRLAFGPDSRELIAILTTSESVWLENRVSSPFDGPAEQAALRMACRQFPRIDDANQTAARAVAQWTYTENPVRARFTAWAENHFSTWIEKTKSAPKWREHLDFCRAGVAPFGDLLNVSAHSPAMVVYLDQEKSYAKKLNENYAREIMELHTLGVHGGYAQSDVTTLAGVLNGWTLATESVLPDTDGAPGLVYNGGNEANLTGVFRYDPLLNDGKARRVFGLEFPAAEPAARYDGIHLALEMLAAHPGTAEHVCRKLAEHYVGAPADDGLVRTLARTYLENGGDLRPVLRVMASSNVFWNSAPKMATPLDYGLRVARLCRAAVLDLGGNPDQASPRPEQVAGFLKKSGMGLFERVTPDGYPQNSESYMDSNALLQRWHFMEAMLEPLNRLVPGDWRTPPAPAITQAANEDPGRFSSPADDGAQRFIDLAAVRLTGRLLAPGSNQAARELLGDSTSEQTRQTLLLISLLPETSLR